MRRVSFAHHGRAACLQALDLRVDEGETVLVESPSGGGKSTLLRIAAGLIPRVQGGRFSGAALVDGELAHRLPIARYPRTLGWVPQDPETGFVARTVERELLGILENSGWVRRDARARIDEVLAEFNVAHLSHREVATLSGGEAARVALAAALVAEPRHLLLDEPEAQLDAAARLELAGTLRALSAGGLALVVGTHAPHVFRSLGARVLLLGGAPTSPERVALPLPTAGPAVLDLDRVSFRYGEGGGVGPVDLELAPGEVVALAGPNGSGKSTLLHLAAGLLAPQEGRVGLCGRSPCGLPARELAARVGLAFQEPAWHVTQDKVRDEVNLTGRTLGLAVPFDEVLCDFGLEHLAGAHPWDLSGGERQRLAVATAAAHDPPVLLLDEPTRGLDGLGLERLVGLLARRSRRGLATVVATHNAALASFAHRVVRLEAGLVREERALAPEVAA